jgi:TetR/AcrR family transcriptional regulator, regulator of cefoperazone and chloramphenicol sensitivity
LSDDSTRSRVIDAAISCILDEGFYRASSNKIARRAGVTWGVIQYHFGTREALLLAVHERGLDELGQCLDDAVITGTTMEARLRSFVDALWSYYGRPEFLAYMQVMLNLSHDPTTADSTRTALQSVGARVNERMPALVRAVLATDLPDEEVERIGRFVYNVVRGLALDQELLEAMPIEHSSSEEFAAQRGELVQVLARGLEADC